MHKNHRDIICSVIVRVYEHDHYYLARQKVT